MALRAARSHWSRRPWPSGSALRLVHACLWPSGWHAHSSPACPWPSGWRAHTGPGTSVALRAARSHWSTRGHRRLIAASAEPPSGLQPGSAVSAPGEQMQGSDPASPWRSCLFPNVESVVCPAASVLWQFQEESLACILSSIFLAVIVGVMLSTCFTVSNFYHLPFKSLRKINTPALGLVPQIIPVQELNHLTKHRDALEAVCPAVFSGFCGASSRQWERGLGWRGASPLPLFCFSSPSPSKSSPPRLETQGQRRGRLTRGGVGEE